MDSDTRKKLREAIDAKRRAELDAPPAIVRDELPRKHTGDMIHPSSQFTDAARVYKDAKKAYEDALESILTLAELERPQGVSIQLMAEEMGVTRQALYNHMQKRSRRKEEES